MRAPTAALPADLVRTGERVIYAAMLVLSLLVYAALILGAVSSPEVGVSIVFYGLIFVTVAFLARGVALGRVRGNGIRVSPTQLPLVHALAAEHAARLGLDRCPDLYVVESGGVLNAFTTRFLGRDFLVIHSDVLELALQQGKAAVGFVVAHELGHIWRGHLKRRWLITPARFVPYLGSAYSRACEYTCDRVGAFCQPDGAISGLIALAAGKQLYPHVDPREFAAQAQSDSGFWIRRAEMLSSHPRFPKRVAALLEAGVSATGARPMAGVDATVAA